MTGNATVYAHKACIAELAGGINYLQNRPIRPALEAFSDRVSELIRGVRQPHKRQRTLELEAEEVQFALINQAIREDTLVEYSRCIVAMEDALAPSNFEYVSEAAFKIFLGILASQGASVKTAGKYCAALYHFQLGCRYGLKPGEDPWASRESNATLRKMFSGFAFKAGTAESVASRTGVIDEARVDEIDAWIERDTDSSRQATDRRLAFGLRKVVQMALRQIEVRHARCEHYEPRERMLTIIRDKRNNAKAALPTGRFPIRRKWIVSEHAHKWLCDRQATAKTGDFIFDPKLYKVADMADLVKRAAHGPRLASRPQMVFPCRTPRRRPRHRSPPTAGSGWCGGGGLGSRFDGRRWFGRGPTRNCRSQGGHGRFIARLRHPADGRHPQDLSGPSQYTYTLTHANAQSQVSVSSMHLPYIPLCFVFLSPQRQL